MLPASNCVEPGKANVLGTNRACPACRSLAHRPIGAKAGYALLHCAICGTIFPGTNPGDGALDELYDHYYDHANFTLHPVVSAALDRLVRSFSPFRATNRWLDVGYGAGGLLSIAENHGWSCHGVEVSPSALRHGAERGWLVAESLEASGFPSGGFDVVTMIELIEHVTVPDELLESTARLLRPGGQIFVTTPNAHALNRRILGIEWSVIAPPEHLTIWSPQGLRQLLMRTGFVPIRVRTEGFNPREVCSRVCRTRPGAATFDRNAAALELNAFFSRGCIRRSLKTAINGGLSVLRAGDRLKVWAIRGPGHGAT